MVVSRDKLRALAGETLQQLAKNDELELLYLHLASMRNFNDVKDRLIGALADKPELDAGDGEGVAEDEAAGPKRQPARGKAAADV